MTVYTVNIPPVWNPSRQALNDILSAILAAFMANTPGVIRKYWSELPQSLTGEGPFVYQGPINETIVHDQGTRATTYNGYLGYVDVLADPQETNTRCNAFADYMREMFTFNARISVGSTGTGSTDAVLRETRLVDGPTELVQGNARLTDVRLEFEFNVLEGRN
ncbi:MAG: hypothetical protein PHS14_20700 [Elusimicrobia bacterium]|nr:hypothetical protein [Elusimicrobiota bacterium]